MGISVTDLTNLPDEITVTKGSTTVQDGNRFQSVEALFNFSIFCRLSRPLVFKNGDVVRVGVRLNQLESRNFRLYARGITNYSTSVGSPGAAVWSAVPSVGHFIGSGAIGADANNSYLVGTGNDGAVLSYEITLVNGTDEIPITGFAINFGTVDSTGGTARTTCTADFLYLYAGSPSVNPYEAAGISTTGGGGGTFTVINDDIDFPSLPTFGALNAGFVSIWTPDEKQVQDLAGYMWTTDIFTSAFWKNLVQNPLELIFGLSIMPIQRGTDDDYVRLGWINTGLKMYYRDNQYYEVDCGSIDMQEYWKAFFDYSPYTKISIYLPYIGVKDLDTNDLMGRVVSLKYIIDLATGTCVAMIKCGDSVYYHFSGVCSVQIPVTAIQMQEVIKGAVTAAVGVATVATAPALAASAAGAMAAQVGGAASAISGVYQHATGKDVARSGSFTGNAGFMSVQKPYLIISRPRQAMPEDQQVYTGFPAFITKKLDEVEGYTEVQIIHLHNMSCTDEEITEIDNLLREGVIL